MTEADKNGAAPAAPKGKAMPKAKDGEKKTSTGFGKALQVSRDPKAMEGKLNLPKWTDASGGKYVGKDMAEFFRMKDAADKRLQHMDFTDCDLTEADFTGINLQGCRFRGAILKGTVFLDCDLRWADFRGADASEAIFHLEDEDGNITRAANLREAQGVQD